MEHLKVKTSHLQELSEISDQIDPYSCKDLFDSVKSQKLKLVFSIKKFEKELLLKGNIIGYFGLECSRCLEVSDWPVNVNFMQAYSSSVEEINVGEEARQVLLLNIPQKPLCKNDCDGLCPKCGKNLNSGKCSCKIETNDLRWEKLKDILKK
ncbi:MAG: DUF177 domain-containing protein [Elusimicrobia bacterium]|nr:DUF177 domain-containing protein [Candidatus Liberimonas magnetica]